ncbi:MAG: flagellar biosynthetic protein FliO [Syntrophobacteraceae bacterium]
MESGLLFLKTAGALGLVLGLLFALLYALKRWGNQAKRPASQAMMEVLSKQSFGPRHHLILVKVSGERKVLVGVSPQNMSLLSLNAPAPSGKNSFDDAIENI